MLRAIAGPLRKLSNVGFFANFAARPFSVTSCNLLKEIRERREGDALILEGVHVRSPREGQVVKTDSKHGECSLCALGIDVKHTDVLIIKQFMDHNAQLYPRNITGLCRWQQRKMKYLIEMATRAGLLNSGQPIPAYQRGWRKFNSYYDESEIPASRSEIALAKLREFDEAYKIAKAERDAHEEMLTKRRAEKKMLLNK